jgi:hypothetical protein
VSTTAQPDDTARLHVRPVQGNATKRERYAHAHERLKLARKMGFHIEATMICESILSDRLHSHFHWRVIVAKILKLDALPERFRGRLVFDRPVNFTLLAGLLKLDFDHLDKEHYLKLPSRLLTWAPLRNKAAHGYAFTFPALKTFEEDHATYRHLCQECSDTGADLVRLMTNWDRAYRSAHRKQAGQ